MKKRIMTEFERIELEKVMKESDLKLSVEIVFKAFNDYGPNTKWNNKENQKFQKILFPEIDTPLWKAMREDDDRLE